MQPGTRISFGSIKFYLILSYDGRLFMSINQGWSSDFKSVGVLGVGHEHRKSGGMESCFCESAGVATPVTPAAATRLLSTGHCGDMLLISIS